MSLLQECPKCKYKNPMQTWKTVEVGEEIIKRKTPLKVCRCGFKIGKASGKAYWIEFYENGQRKRERIGPNKEAAEQRLREVLKLRTEERFIEKDPAAKLSLGELCDWYLKLPEVKAKDSYRRDGDFIKHLKRLLGENTKIKHLNPGKVESYQRQRLEEPSRLNKKKKKISSGENTMEVENAMPIKKTAPGTVNRETACLKTILNRAVRHGKLLHNPLDRLKKLPENNIRMRILTAKEFESLLNACPSHIQPIILIGYYMGLRRSEILLLTWPEVDLQKGFIRLSAERTKTDQGRVIPIHPRVREALAKLPRGLHTDRLFLFDGEPFEEFRNSFKTACRDAGIKDFVFHDLRHCALNNLRQAGNDYFRIMALSGHKTMSCFKRYNLVTEEELSQIKWPTPLGKTRQMDTNMDTNEKGATASMP